MDLRQCYGNLTGSVAKMRPAAKAPKSTDLNNGGGKDMGSRRQDYGFWRIQLGEYNPLAPFQRKPASEPGSRHNPVTGCISMKTIRKLPKRFFPYCIL
jgi:hypothetical protein